MKRPYVLLLSSALIITAFISGGVAVPALTNVFVTNFPLDSKGNLRTSGNVSVTFPVQTSSIPIVPFNTTIRAALSSFPLSLYTATSFGVTTYYRYVTFNISQWTAYRGNIFSQVVRPGASPWNSSQQRPSVQIYACFRTSAFPATIFSCPAVANFQLYVFGNVFSNSTGTFVNPNLGGSAQNVDEVQGSLIDVILTYNSFADTTGLLDSVNIGLALYLKR